MAVYYEKKKFFFLKWEMNYVVLKLKKHFLKSKQYKIKKLKLHFIFFLFHI